MAGKFYLDVLARRHPHKSEPELELFCASDRELRQVTGLSATEHRTNAMKLLFPSRDWHDWRKERIDSVEECVSKGIKELCWMGAASSGKSADMADLLLALWWASPAFTTIYISSPFEEHGKKGLFALIQEQFAEARDLYPKLPGVIKKASNSLDFNDRTPRSFIRQVSLDEVGKMKGKKSIDTHRGLIVVAVNELPNFTPSAAQSFVDVLGNLHSNKNLLVLADGNFANIADAFGILCAPDERDIPGGYHGFNPDKHFRWRTNRKGLVLRFDGLQSPNVKAGADIYPYLTSIEFIAMHASWPGGLQSPLAMREVRSAPVTALDEFTVTNGERIRAGGCYDDYEFTGEDVTKMAFVDAGLGGDACVVQKMRMGWVKGPGPRRQILALWDAPYTIPIKVGIGETPEVQVALGMKEHLEAAGIDPENVGFDAALRPALAQQIAKHYSPHALAIDSNGPASARPVNATQKKEDGKTPMTWKDKVDRLLSEYWFAFASMIDSGQIRGLALSPKGVEQLCTRRWSRHGKRDRLDTKGEYKDLLKAMGRIVESPNEADALVGAAELARRNGFAMLAVAPKGGVKDMILKMLREREALRLKAEIQGSLARQALPSGRLRAIQPPSHNRARLHR